MVYLEPGWTGIYDMDYSYADDTQLFLHTRAENSAATFTRLQICIDDVGELMSANRLKLNTGKTQFTCLGTRQQLAKVDVSTLSANGSTVDHLCNVTCLGVTIDQQLSFADYVRRLSDQCFYWLRQIRVIRRSLTTDTIMQGSGECSSCQPDRLL